MTFHRSRPLVFFLFIGFGAAAALLPAAAVAQTKPVTVTITEIEQIGDDFDPFSLGDFYAHVTIDGTTLSTFDDRFSFDGGLLTPSGPLYPDPAWVLTRQVPFTLDTVAVRIELFDDDLVTGAEEANLDPGPGNDLDIVVDLATGRWSGDVDWPQSCVAGGHGFGGQDARVCFDISVLSESGDADGDGLLDGWELSGFNAGEDETTDFDFPAFGANPLRKDAFVEVDCLVASNHSHCPLQGSITDVIQAYANAPVLNPDGTTGVQLHVDVGPLYGMGLVTPVNGPGGVTGNFGDMGGGNTIPEAGNEVIEGFGGDDRGGRDFSDIQVFDQSRLFLFRYAIFGHQTNVRKVTNDCTSGQAHFTPGRVFFVTLGGVSSSGGPCHGVVNNISVGNQKQQAGTFMHELGHSLGLQHGGDEKTNKKPNYLSVMSYAFQDCDVPASPNGALPGNCDYSRISLPSLDERSLDECLGPDSGLLGFGAVNFDGDTIITGMSNCQGNPVNTIADINNDGICVTPGDNLQNDSTISGDDMTDRESITDGRNRRCNSTANHTAPADDEQETAVGETPDQPDVLTGFEDWNSLQYSLQELVRSDSSGDSPQDEPDPQTIADARAFLATLLAPNVVLEKTGPATARPGDVITHTLEIRNPGDGPTITLVSVTSNEPETGFLGEGDKGPDIQGAALGTDDRSFSLRSERGTGNGSTGRVYTIVYRATDQYGNASEATATVTVPTDGSGLN